MMERLWFRLAKVVTVIACFFLFLAVGDLLAGAWLGAVNLTGAACVLFVLAGALRHG